MANAASGAGWHRSVRGDASRVALIVDHPRRDLAGLVLTAHELCQQGIVCHLVPFNLQRRETWALRPDLVLLNYLRRGSNEDFGRELCQTGIQFGLLDTEGGVWSSAEEYARILWADGELLKQATCVCFWGAEVADHAVGEGLFLREQVTVTGCPRFDLYHAGWRSLLGNGAAAPEADEESPRILVNTNCSIANPAFKSPERQREIIESLGWAAEKVSDLLEAEHELIGGFIDLVHRLSADYPDSHIVLRPHPFENPNLYREKLNGLPNVEINANGAVQAQIFKARVVIQRSCTTGVEAALAGVPTVSPQWFRAPHPIPVVEQMSIPAPSYADLRASLDAIFAGQYEPSHELRDSIDRGVRDWFYGIDGLSHKRVADAVRACLGGSRELNEQLCAELLFGIRSDRRGRLPKILGRIRYALGLPPDWSFRRMQVISSPTWPRSDKFFGAAEVRQIVDKIQGIVESQGHRAVPIEVALALDRGDYHNGYEGFAVTMSPAVSAAQQLHRMSASPP